MKDRLSNDLSYVKAGYRSDKWKWVLSLPQSTPAETTTASGYADTAQVVGAQVEDSKENGLHEDAIQADVKSSMTEQNGGSTKNHSSEHHVILENQLVEEQLLKVYGMDKRPKLLPCPKKCSNSPWCLAELKVGTGQEKSCPTDEPRDPLTPVGLQNTANTCWINSALQALFHLPKFRYVINSVGGFTGEENLSCITYLLQAMFVEMETNANRAIACSAGSVFEKMGLYATQEIMRKDTDHEVLKCVSEFLENTIDTLVADPKIGPELCSLFSTSLTRIAKWKCPMCEREHKSQLAPTTSYIMAAYVSADECPLDQCLVDMQTETQTGVSLLCGSPNSGMGGCGARVTADRVVTPKIKTLPTILVIRNNSLVDHEMKRRLHVVYPEVLDLSSLTQNHTAATYTLAAVIFHHGYWVKHFSAHVKTGAKWYNFNDEQVSELTNRATSGNPQENHRNYFSLANVSQKYKQSRGLRVSRGAFVWIYVNTQGQEKEVVPVPPPEPVIEYVLKKQQEGMNVTHHYQAEMRKEKEVLLTQCAVADLSESYTLISEPLLSSWYKDDSLEYIPQPSVLAQVLCEHKLFSPLKYNLLKCIRTDAVKDLLTHQFGIHEDKALLKLGLPVTLSSENGYCKACVAKYANHILFIERVKALYKRAKKDARTDCDGPVKVVGSKTLEYWPRLATSAYVKEHGIDFEDNCETENGGESSSKANSSNKYDPEVDTSDIKVTSTTMDCSDVKEKCDTLEVESVHGCDSASAVPNNECKIASENEVKELESAEKRTPSIKEKESSKEGSSELMLFNEDIVCQHSLQSPTAVTCNLPQELAEEIMDLCSDSIHPAIYQNDFDICHQCREMFEESVQNCESGRLQKKQLCNLYLEKKRPHPLRDQNTKIYLISRDFYQLWKRYIRSCEREDLVIPPERLENASLLCTHGQLLFPVFSLQLHEITEHFVLVWEEEWMIMKDLYQADHIITGHFSDAGLLLTYPIVCENGCVERRLAQDYEEQFSYDHQIIHVRQVTSVNDIPRRSAGRRRSPCQGPSTNNESLGPRKKSRLAFPSMPSHGSNTRLVRASRTFSSTDTIREVQNFIAERTGIWPMLQTLWVCGEQQLNRGDNNNEPMQLTDEDRALTLNALRVLPGDTIYFRAAVEDMERAAGDGVMEFNEIAEN